MVLILRATLLLCLTLALQGSTREWQYRRLSVTARARHTVTARQILTAQTQLVCGLHCHGQDACNAFTFDPKGGQCVLLTGLLLEEGDVLEEVEGGEGIRRGQHVMVRMAQDHSIPYSETIFLINLFIRPR